ncbi:MAG: YifB family Mg chelatase-like AAA ATPase [Hespellia sp.]|nr:YifB family Mg chelatase-like AAA ATPase [Hespellia sp.]
MYSTVHSAALDGMQVEMIRVEADVSNGLPMFHMVGYLSSEVKEAGERVRAAIRNTGICLLPKKMIVNLSPAAVRKRGASFDLPIAVAVLAAYEVICVEDLKDVLFVGELGLNGELLKVSGILPTVIEARHKGYRVCVVPGGNEREGSVIQGIQIVGAKTLAEVLDYIRDPDTFQRKRKETRDKVVSITKFGKGTSEEVVDFQDVSGQEMLKRAAEIAVAGQHNLLMIGTPGASKTMIAQRIPTILPPLELEESIEISKVYSILGLLDTEHPLIVDRPFRKVHHTATRTALAGGGLHPAPGEISLAHGGVLMLDELAEFPKSVLEVLRQPMEEQEIQIVRSRGTYYFPADFLLISAMNPCPCGYYPDRSRCTCTEAEVNRYLGKISQPLLSRIDLCVEAPRVEYGNLKQTGRGESSAKIRARVCHVREIQRQRYKGLKVHVNGRLSAREVEKYCVLDAEGEAMMQIAYDRLGLTARTYHKVLKVARTIADLSEAEVIRAEHLAEALGLRMPDQKYWG